MNFNPNSYMNYPFYQGGIPSSNPYIQPQSQATQTQQGLSGKFVENKDILNVTEVPIGGYGIFPKVDLTEVYAKVWNPNARQTETLTYKLTTPEAIAPQPDVSALILERMNALEEKLDKIAAVATPAPQEEIAKPAQVKKEVNVNAY